MKPGVRVLLCISIALIVSLFLYIQRKTIAGIAITLLYSCLFTAVLSPLCSKIERIGISSSLSAVLSIALLIVVSAVIVSSILPLLVIKSAQLIRRCLPILRDVSSILSNTFNSSVYSFIDFSKLFESAAAGLSKAASIFARGSLAFAAETGKLGFSLIISYYALKERSVLGSYLLLTIPTAWRERALLTVRASKNAISGYFISVMKTSLFVGTVTAVGLLIIGVSDALLLGFIMGILEVLPYIGPVIGAIPILLSTIPLGIHRTVYALILIILIQQAESSFVGPYFTASSTSIHPLAALLSVYILSSLIGIWGTLLAVPLVVTLRSVLWSAAKYRIPAKA